MLSERYKQIVEDIASSLQSTLEVKDPRKYDIDRILDFLENANCQVQFSEKSEKDAKNGIKANFSDGVIYLNYSKEDLSRDVNTHNDMVVYKKII